MPLVSAIEKRGFRKWYERELVRSHSHLVLLLFCALAAVGALEAFSNQRGSDKLLMLVSLLTAAAIGAWAVRRYLFYLMRAELIAHQASCGQCAAYGRWRVERHEPAAADEASVDGAPMAMRVCCVKCGHRWRIAW